MRAVEAARAGQAPSLDELVVTDTADAWRRAGFHVQGDGCEVGGVRIHVAGPGGARGIVAWSVRDAASLDLDGLATTASERAPAQGGEHPNGVVAIDHLVLMTPDLDRTTQEAQLKETIPVFQAPEGKPYGWMEPTEWEAFARWMEESGQLRSGVVVQRAYTNEFLPGEGI